jgi:hypothetical protein
LLALSASVAEVSRVCSGSSSVRSSAPASSNSLRRLWLRLSARPVPRLAVQTGQREATVAVGMGMVPVVVARRWRSQQRGELRIAVAATLRMHEKRHQHQVVALLVQRPLQARGEVQAVAPALCARLFALLQHRRAVGVAVGGGRRRGGQVRLVEARQRHVEVERPLAAIARPRETGR